MSLDAIKEQLRRQRDELVTQVDSIRVVFDAAVAELTKKFHLDTDATYDEVKRIEAALDVLDGKIGLSPPPPIASAPPPPPVTKLLAPIAAAPAPEEPRFGPPRKTTPPPTPEPAPSPIVPAAPPSVAAPVAEAKPTPGPSTSEFARMYRERDIYTPRPRGGRNVNPRELKVGVVVNFDFEHMGRLKLDHSGNFHTDRDWPMVLLEVDGDTYVWAPLALREGDDGFEVPRNMKQQPGFVNSTWLSNDSWVIRDRFRLKKEHLQYTNQIGDTLRSINPVLVPKIMNWLYRGIPDVMRLAR